LSQFVNNGVLTQLESLDRNKRTIFYFSGKELKRILK